MSKPKNILIIIVMLCVLFLIRSFVFGSQNHYHTVVGDRYSLSRDDLDAYYNHYEYGDDYGIDDYLEVEGYVRIDSY